ncbi:uncharacterized protein N7459_001537 [Penicillium hispanicum]|uniref:uncharacterized protein n=1 Tax=Penicillium hispanicum TaxID=1080232 RepID=UPI002540EC7D|nr:uncharacterized protein N7459_001537 [Penicillium hispanicum]KAJ5595329.1 hypothetical protein N7459_001537 [Penicillium hispanicum]
MKLLPTQIVFGSPLRIHARLGIICLLGSSPDLIMSTNLDQSSSAADQQSRGSRSRYYFGSKNVQRVRDSTCPSPSRETPDSFESAYSDERSIFNAIQVPTPKSDPHSHEITYHMSPVLEEGLAANMAMFIPASSSQDGHSSTLFRHYRRAGQREGKVWWRNLMLSDQGSQRTQQPASSPSSETVAIPENAPNRHRKAVSLSTFDGKGLAPSWPGPLPPAVTTLQPHFPPPERAPTPPGLPSFNTPEAIHYSAQFLAVGNGGRSSVTSHLTSATATAPRATSYGDVLRRFFGLSPSNEPNNSRSVVGIGRAEDGTIVQGRFPVRQSGHGVSPNRQLQDHPFHQSNLPIAHLETEEQPGETTTEGTSTKEFSSRPQRRPRTYALPSIGRLWPSPDAHISSTPESLESPRPRRPINAAEIIGIQRTLSRSNVTSDFTPASSQAGPARTVDSTHSRLPPSPLQSVLVDDRHGSTDTGSSRERYTISDVLTWLTVHLYMCCCLGIFCVPTSAESPEPLEATTSRETYTTAQTRMSAPAEGSQYTGQNMLSYLVASVYSFFSSHPKAPAQSPS